MADYMTEFSFAVEIAATAADQAVADIVAALTANMEDAPHPGRGPQFDTGFYGDLDVEVLEGTPTRVVLSAPAGHGSVEIAVTVVQWLLATQPGTPSKVFFEWANTCSRPRIDEFGGGAALVTSTHVVLRSTADLRELLEAELPAAIVESGPLPRDL